MTAQATATLTRSAAAKMLARVEHLCDRIHGLRYTESLGGGSPLSTLDTDRVARENGHDAVSEKGTAESELRGVVTELMTGGISAKRINYAGSRFPRDLVALEGTGEWAEVAQGEYQEVERFACQI